jgi:adenine-specific DNA-methyltransferase
MNDNFLTVDEVASTLKVTRQTIAKYIKSKELNAVKINKNYRIAQKDFNTFLSDKSLNINTEYLYLKKSKYCTLDYNGKIPEYEILESKYNGIIRPLEVNHNLPYNKFIFGDNYFTLKTLLQELKDKIDLIYIDPPFGTGQSFSNIDKNHAFSDKLINNDFLEFLRKRLILLKELLSIHGSIYIHIDKKIGHYVKIIMDEIFGSENYINDITRIKCNPKNFCRNAYGNISDLILFYAKKRDFNIWNDIREDLTKEEIEKLFPKEHSTYGKYTTNPLHAPGETLDGDTGKEWNGLKPPKGRHWRYSREELTKLENKGLIEWSNTGNPRKIVYLKDHIGTKIQDVWEMKDKGMSYINYPTQKNHKLLERIILNSSNENSIVLDCFAGSGGTLLVANKLKRNWIGMDNSTQSLEIVKKIFKKENVKCNYFEYLSLD